MIKKSMSNHLQRLGRVAAATLAIAVAATGAVCADPSDTRDCIPIDVWRSFDVDSALGSQADLVDAPSTRDFGAIDPVLTYELDRLFDVKQASAQLTRTDTGISFMLTQNGLYVVGLPAVEWIHQFMEITSN